MLLLVHMDKKIIKIIVDQKIHSNIKSRASLCGKSIKEYLLICEQYFVDYAPQKIEPKTSTEKIMTRDEQAAAFLDNGFTTHYTNDEKHQRTQAMKPAMNKAINKKIAKRTGHDPTCPCAICKPPKKKKSLT